MDILYIPQLDAVSSESGVGGASHYRFLRRTLENRTVVLTDRAVTKVDITSSEPVTIVFPPAIKGHVRDFFIRIVITANEVPEIIFTAPEGESISFEGVDDNLLACEVGVNVFSFTETDNGIFLVSRKQIDYDVSVEFDPCEGAMDSTIIEYTLGVMYSKLPTPIRDGYVFKGWYTSPDGGEMISADDICSAGVVKLYAHWEVYVDPYREHICVGNDLSFFSEGDALWVVDESQGSNSQSSVRSGAITDNESTTLKCRVTGKGKLTFDVKTSCESNYDLFNFYVDDSLQCVASGHQDWTQQSFDITEDGIHELRWTYYKDGSVAEGSDCCWIDNIRWEPMEG